MRSRETQSTNPSPFDLAFEAWRALDDEPPNTEAELSGPWRVVMTPGGWGCFAEGESRPNAAFHDRHLALLAAAALPATATANRFHLGDPHAEGPTILDAGEVAGSTTSFNPEFVAGLGLLAALIASPSSLAFVLEAAGATAVERTGKILAQRLQKRGGR